MFIFPIVKDHLHISTVVLYMSGMDSCDPVSISADCLCHQGTLLLTEITLIRVCFLSLARSKLRLCSANHGAGYFSNLTCDWLSIVWAYSEQETENGPWIQFMAWINDYIYMIIGDNSSSFIPQLHWLELDDGMSNSILQRAMRCNHLFIAYSYINDTWESLLERKILCCRHIG